MSTIGLRDLAARRRHHLHLLAALAVCSAVLPAQDLAPVRVFILAGQSNMQGQGVVDFDHPKYYNGGKGNLNQVAARPATAWRYQHARSEQGEWITRDDVFIRFRTKDGVKTGGLSVGFTGYGGRHHIGPEFQFGHVVGEAYEEPVLLIKTAWGGKSLHTDFRPPSAGGTTGVYYKKMLAEIAEALREVGGEMPALAKRKLVIEGFVWFQGWNDMVSKPGRAEYADNLVHLLGDVRKHLGLPKLPVIVGELGNDGKQAGKSILEFRKAQREACKRLGGDGSVVFVPTTEYARARERSPNTGHGHHYYGNAESYFLIGDAFAHCLLDTLGVGRRVVRDLPYSAGADPYQQERCKLDLYIPAAAKNAPTLVWFHGGGLVNGSKQGSLATSVGRLLAARGYIVAMANYRLSPRAKYPAYVEDAAAATAWTIRNVAAYGGDPERVFVGGHSAGAYLSLMVGLDASYLGKYKLDPKHLAGLLPVSGQTDSHWTVRAERGIGRATAVVDATAPLTHVKTKAPPMLLIVADRDLKGRVDLNKRLHAALLKTGHQGSALHEMPGRSHSSLISQLASPQDPTLKLLLEFLRVHAAR